MRAYRTTLPRFGYSRAARHRRDADPSAASRRPSRTCPAARCSARPSTTRIACSTSRWPPAREPPPSPQPRDGRAEPMPRVTDLLGREGLIERDAAPPTDARRRRPHPRAAGVSRRPRPAPAGPGARRRRLPAGARLFDAARLWPHPSLRRRDPLRRGRGGVRCRRELGFAVDARRDHASPNARWSTSSRARPRRRRSSPAATAWSSASASARRWRWRWSTARCAPRELGEDVDAAGAGRGVRAVALRQRRRRPASSST